MAKWGHKHMVLTHIYGPPITRLLIITHLCTLLHKVHRLVITAQDDVLLCLIVSINVPVLGGSWVPTHESPDLGVPQILAILGSDDRQIDRSEDPKIRWI